MTFDVERQIIESYVQSNLTGTPVKYDNVPFDQETADSFVSLSILSGTGSNISIGQLPRQRYAGIIQFDIYVPENTGTANARSIATSIRELFNNQTLPESDGIVIRTRPPTLNRVAKGPTGKYRINVNVPYSLDIQQTS